MKIQKFIIVTFVLFVGCVFLGNKNIYKYRFLYNKGGNYYVNGTFFKINPFYISPKLLSETKYYKLMEFPKKVGTINDSLPIRGINFYSALLYCNQISKAENLDTIYSYNGIEFNNNEFILKKIKIRDDKIGYRLPYFSEMSFCNRSLSSNVPNKYFKLKSINGYYEKNGLYCANKNLSIWVSDSLNSNKHAVYGSSYGDKYFNTDLVRIINDSEFKKYRNYIGIRVILQDSTRLNSKPIVIAPSDTSVFVSRKIKLVPKYFDECLKKCKKYVEVDGSMIKIENDSVVFYAPSKPSILNVKFIIVDNDSLVDIKRSRIGVYYIPPVVVGEKRMICSVNDSVLMKKRFYDDKIIKQIKWKFGRNGVFKKGNDKIKFKAPSRPIDDFEVVAKVTDSDGEIIFDTTDVTVLANAPLISTHTEKNTWINKHFKFTADVIDNGYVKKHYFLFNDNIIPAKKYDTVFFAPKFPTNIIVGLIAIDNDSMVSKKIDTVNVYGPEGPSFMKYVPGGKYHNKRINDFFIDSVEVTQKRFFKIMGYNPSKVKGDLLPVTNVSWLDAIMYCNKLSKNYGLDTVYFYNKKVRKLLNKKMVKITGIKRLRNKSGFVLPKTIEWRFLTSNYEQSNLNNSVFRENSNGNVAVVASKKGNKLKIYDLYGNVAEWCDEGVLVGGSYFSFFKNIKNSEVIKMPIKAKIKTNGFRTMIFKKHWENKLK